jgi:hypothetical protein
MSKKFWLENLKGRDYMTPILSQIHPIFTLALYFFKDKG